jgi:hypothetical protein
VPDVGVPKFESLNLSVMTLCEMLSACWNIASVFGRAGSIWAHGDSWADATRSELHNIGQADTELGFGSDTVVR